jgi:hypothetical protein
LKELTMTNERIEHLKAVLRDAQTQALSHEQQLEITNSIQSELIESQQEMLRDYHCTLVRLERTLHQESVGRLYLQNWYLRTRLLLTQVWPFSIWL